MTRKIMLFLMTFIFIAVMVACDDTLTTSTTTSASTSSETDSTTSTSNSSSTTTTTTTTTSGTTTSESQTTQTTTQLTDLIPVECSSIEIVDGWVPTWCDEFKYVGGVDPTKWIHVVGGGGFGNYEEQYYTSRSQNAYVDGEYLTITALKEEYENHHYTSAKIWTQENNQWENGTSWKYGKFEMRAKLPAGRGTWPAFWMMPKSSTYGGWPNSGEIDIMEHVGYNPNVVLGTLHSERFYGTNGRGGSTTSLITSGQLTSIDVLNEFHTYGMIWSATKIEWFFDGLSIGSVSFNPRVSNAFAFPTSVDWPYDQKFYMILNLAIGGTWGGAQGIDDTIFPTEFVIDYVRVFQQDYISDDTENPSQPTGPAILYKVSRTAFLTWNPSTDDNEIKRYAVYVNGVLRNYTSVNGIQLTSLKAAFDNIITVVAEDYAGNLSNPMQTVITIE